MPLNRRSFLHTGLFSVGALAGCSSFGTPATTPHSEQTESERPETSSTDEESLESLELSVETLASGFGSPVDVAVPEAGDRYVADQFGTVSRITPDGEIQTVLDVTDRMVEISGFDERGLLGVAFHPDYDGSGRLFVRYSAPRREGTPSNYSHTFVLAEFEVSDGDIDPDSELTILEISQPQANHNAGAIGFGPDGYLYVAVGDGGGGGDQGRGHVEDWYDRVAGGNGQDVTENLLGSILRIDVDKTDDDRSYGIPDDNPLVGRDGFDEHYAWGFRNPWRFSFGPDGRLFVADVGQSDYEEVSIVQRGGNYGWNVREGTHCFDARDCPSETPAGEPLIDPVIEYPHGGADVSGISVIGGFLYAGEEIASLDGRYVFADWRANGRLFVASERSDGQWPTTTVPVVSDEFGSNVLSFGQTPDRELLVCTTDGSESSGAVYRLHDV